MTTTVLSRRGHPYRLHSSDRDGQLYLHRKSRRTKEVCTFAVSLDDVLNVCNAMVDAVESGN